MSEWTTSALEDLCEITSSKRIFYHEYVKSGIPFYRSKEIIELSQGRPVSTDLFIDPEKFHLIKHTHGAPVKNDILLTSVGTLGVPYLVKQLDEFYFKDGNLIWFRNWGPKILPEFVLWWIRSKSGQQTLLDISIGSTQPALTISGLKKLEVPIPPYTEQQAIAEVLGSLDDKIDLLHRNSKTIEQLAETLFRQWFVEQATEGWKEVTLSCQLEFQYGKSLREDKRTGNGFPVFGSGGLAGYHDEYLVKGPGVIIGRKGTIGTVTYVFENFFPIDTTFYVTSKRATANYLYEYHLLKTLGLKEMNSDSAVPGLNRDAAMSLKTLLPPEDLMKSYEDICSPLFDKIRKNRSQIHCLESIRDTLLPKLMSGEIRLDKLTESPKNMAIQPTM